MSATVFFQPALWALRAEGAEGKEETVVRPPYDMVEAGHPPDFDEVYERWFDFVWRSVRRLGIEEASVDDAVQEVFLVVYRRLPDFEGRSTVKTWLFGIVLKVVRTHRRAASRKGRGDPLPGELPDARSPSQEHLAAQREAVVVLDRILEALDEDKRAVFVLAELEQMTAPEIADALGVKLNTVYSRLRAARKTFDDAVKRLRAREIRMTP